MNQFRILLTCLVLLLTACSTQTATQLPASEPLQTSEPPLVSTATLPVASTEDLFAQMQIDLPAPACDGGLTPEQTEGPYYMPNTPARSSLLDEGMPGKRLILVGYVLTKDCQPIPGAWLDFWQADASGAYDNRGYILRGHQFTDARGRYFLETVKPGEYPGRTVHIHVKVQPPGGSVLTSQLYFPDVAQNNADGIFNPALLVKLEDRGEYLLAFYNFVLGAQ